MKKSRLITAFLTAVTAASMLSATAHATYIKDGDTPVIDLKPSVEGELKRTEIDLGNGHGKIVQCYVDEKGKPVTGKSLIYFDNSNKNELGSDMRMIKVDKETGELDSWYTGFTKSSKGRCYYDFGKRIYGWYKVGNNWYHFDEKGYADTGRVKICGAYYTFDEKGRWTGKVSKSGVAPKDFKLEISDIHGMSSFDTDGYVFYGEDYDDKKYTADVKFSARDRQIIYCMFLESGFETGGKTELGFGEIEDYMKDVEEDILAWETEPAFGFVIKATVGGKTSEIRYDRVCKQVMHVNKDCFNAYNFAENLFSYKTNTLYKKFPRPENVDWVTIE